MIGLTGCASVKHSDSPTNLTPHPNSSGEYHTTALWKGDTVAIWNQLQHTSPSKLIALQRTQLNPTDSAWIELALISKQKTINTAQLAKALIDWRMRNPSHPANQLIPDNNTLSQLERLPTPEHIAVLLPQGGTYASSSQQIRDGFLNSYYSHLNQTTKQSIKFYDTANASNVNQVYQQAINEGADFIIGPLLKEHVQQLSATKNFHAPTLALNYTDANLSTLPTNFYEFGLLPEDEASQIAERAYEAGQEDALIIAPQNKWGERFTLAFSTRWKALGGNIQDTLYYTANADFNKEIATLLKIDATVDKKLMKESNNKTVLEKQRRQDFNVIFLFAPSKEAHIIVPLLKYYYAGNVPVYASSTIYSGKVKPENDIDLNGVIVCDIPQLKQDNQANPANRLFAVGQDAYLLSLSFKRLVQLPYFPIYGTTGGLTLSSSHQIHRRVPCKPIKNDFV